MFDTEICTTYGYISTAYNDPDAHSHLGASHGYTDTYTYCYTDSGAAHAYRYSLTYSYICADCNPNTR